MAHNKPTYVFDFDGTLINETSAKDFTKLTLKSSIVSLLKTAARDNHIFIVTGRKGNHKKSIFNFLYRNNIPFDGIITQQEDLPALPNHIFKEKAFHMLSQNGHKIVAVVDDNIQVRDITPWEATFYYVPTSSNFAIRIVYSDSVPNDEYLPKYTTKQDIMKDIGISKLPAMEEVKTSLLNKIIKKFSKN